LLFLFRFKKKKIEENYIFLKGTVLFFTDFIRKKIKMFIYKKKSKIFYLIKNLKIDSKHDFYKKFCFQFNHLSRFSQNIIKNLISRRIFSKQMVNIIKNKKNNLCNFSIETTNKFLKNWI
jgi:hypothetical protein